MERTDQDFQDGLALDLFSPKNRTLIANQNTNPLPGSFVTGTTGEPFIALSNYSYIIKVNETAQDLIAKIEIPYDLKVLNSVVVHVSNSFVWKRGGGGGGGGGGGAAGGGRGGGGDAGGGEGAALD